MFLEYGLKRFLALRSPEIHKNQNTVSTNLSRIKKELTTTIALRDVFDLSIFKLPLKLRYLNPPT